MADENIIPEKDNLYFDIQADFGITKHMGGRRATRQLLELCHADPSKTLLVVGCGIGSSLVFIARQFGCRITAIDLSAGMIARAEEMVKRHGLENQITLKVGDAQKLSFEDNHFDAVIAESVNAFLPDQPQGMREYVRVTKPGGYVGINEVTWIKEPTVEIEEYARTIMAGAKFRNAAGWKDLLVNAGLEELVVTSGKFKGGAQLLDELQLTEMSDRLKAMGRFMKGLFTNPVYRHYSRQILSQPGLIFQFTSHIGHGLYVGRKPKGG
jgi:ubiquinone/menaquinone biosynthesis C-methylase UbiE